MNPASRSLITPDRLPWARPRPQLAAAAFTLLAGAAGLHPGASLAAVEFVTPVGVCNKVDTTTDGKDLSVQAGNDVRFEVWGDGIDVNPAVRVTVDDGNADALVTARIVRTHNGAENLLRGCKMAKGSVEVEVDSPAEAGLTRQRSLRFRMPLGDESRLQMRVVPFPTPVLTFVSLRETPTHCLTKIPGAVVQDLNNSRMIINLQPGAGSDTSNCVLALTTQVRPQSPPEIDIQRSFNYTVTAPAEWSLSGGSAAPGALWTKELVFAGNVGLIRRTMATRTSTFTVATPNPNRSDTLTLMITPPALNGFTQACLCRNATTGETVNANDAFQCELRLSQAPPAAGQLISFEARDRNCVAGGANTVSYSSASGLGSFTAPGGSTAHQVPLRALGGPTSAGSACASVVSPVAHTLLFWIGARGAESGPAFTQCQIHIRRPQ